MAGLFDDIIPSGAAGEKQGRVTSGLFSDLTPDSGRPTDGSDDLLIEAQKQFPALKGKNIAFVKTLDAKSNGNMLEAWPPDEPGTPDYPRPKELPLDQYGIQVFNKDTKPSDVAADVVSHFLVKTDPALKAEYDKFAATFSTPDRQARLKEDYEWSKKNEGETRQFNEWATTTRIPDYFRGYVFNQWPDKAKQGMFNDDQRAILDGIASSLKAGQGDGDKESADSSSLFGDLVPERTLGGQVTEAVKGIIPGAVKFGGGALQGGAAAAVHSERAFSRRPLIDMMDRVDRGETVSADDDPVDYQSMSKEDRAAYRASIEKAEESNRGYEPGRLTGSTLFKAGETLQRAGEKILPAAPGYEDSLGRTIGEGLGSVVAGAATSVVAGPTAAAGLFSLSGSGEAIQKAIDAGASEDEILTAAVAGNIPGLTDSLPVEVLLGHIPIPGGKFIKVPVGLLGDALKVGGRIGFQALIEGIQEGGQQFLQNVIAQQIYNPDQPLMEDVPESAALGAAVGGIASGAMAPLHPKPQEKPVEAPPSPAAEAPKITPTDGARVVDHERVDSPRLTPEDRASPIPNDLIDDGKAIIEAATGKPTPELQTAVPTPETSLIQPTERAILRKVGNSDDEIDAMSRDELLTDIEQAVQSGIQANARDVANAEQYQRPADVPPASIKPIPGILAQPVPIASPAPSVAEKTKTVADMTYQDAGLFSSLLMDGLAVKNENGDYTGQTAITLTEEEKDRLRGYGVKVTGEGMAIINAADVQKITALRDKRWTPEERGVAPKAIAGQSIDTLAHEAATSPENNLPEPTQAQKEAGNYKVGRARIGGLDISIENPQGSERKGTDKSGKPWSVTMESHYGYIRGTVGKDKDHIDTFIRPGTSELDDSAPVFVIDQKDPSGGNFDEHKVMMGFDSREEAEQAYRANYTAGWKGMGAITPTTMGEFKTWLSEGNTKEPFAKSAGQGSNIAFRREVAEGFRDNGEAGPRPEVQAFMDSLTPEQRTAAFRDFQQADNVAAARELLDDDTIKEMGLDKPQSGESAVAKEIYRLADAWQAKRKAAEPAPQQALKQKLAAKRAEKAAPVEERGPMFQARSIREGKENPESMGLGGKDAKGRPKRFSTYALAAALEARQRRKYGTIERTDYSREASNRIADWIADEVSFEMQPDRQAKSGAGWYSYKFQRALDKFGKRFPELVDGKAFKDSNLPGLQALKNKKNARDFLTALIAVTSDGQKVAQNFEYATRAYEGFRETGQVDTNVTYGADRNASIRLNLANINSLLASHGPAGMHKLLMEEQTVSDLKKTATDLGVDFSVKYQAHIRLPLAAVIFGPKLGAFYSNLMGSHGYLTMDRWWSRTFNRYRGQLLKMVSGLSDRPTDARGNPIGLARFKKMISQPELSDEEALSLAYSFSKDYEEKGFKDGTDIEKAANTIRKDAEGIEDMPFTSTDRTFMIETTERARQKLARQGLDISIADIQAVLWYFEKRLYAELGAKETADESYEEVADRVASSDRRGREPSGNQAGGSDAPRASIRKDASPGRGGADRRQASQGQDGSAQQVEPLAARFQVSPDQARAIPLKVELPADPLFAEAVANTPGAKITDDGLLIDLVRYQKDEQSGSTSVRTGVFYLPVGSASAKHYKGGKNGYGGKVEVRGETLVKHPLFVKGATGGKAPEAAYDAIKGKGAYEKMRSAVLSIVGNKRNLEENGYNLLEEYGADGNLIYEIIPASQQGNTLAYALQENIVAHAVREAGYDAVIGYSVGRGGKGAFLSEVFDVREIDYPTPGETARLHPDFESRYSRGGSFRVRETSASGVTTEFVLTDAFAEKADELSTRLRKELDDMGLNDVGVRVSESIKAVFKGKTFSVDGRYFRNLIDIALDGRFDPSTTLGHEAIHAMKEMNLFTKAEWEILSRKSNKEWMDSYNIAKNYGMFDAATQTEEGIAHAYGDWVSGAKFDGIIARSFKRIKGLIEALRNSLNGLGFKSAESIFRKAKKGEIGARRRGGAGAANPLFQSAYHGTPHEFDEFSVDKIGTGEGAQVYGWGLYFAGKKSIAEYYRDTLGGRQSSITVDGQKFSSGGKRIGDTNALERAVIFARSALDDKQTLASKAKQIRRAAEVAWRAPGELTTFQREGGWAQGDILDEAAAQLEAWADKDVKTAGRLFQVNVPEDSELMIWDKPLNKQPVKEKIEEALTSQLNTAMSRGDDWAVSAWDRLLNDTDWDSMTGEEFIRAVGDRLARDPASGEGPGGRFDDIGSKAPRLASEWLMSHGIPGHRYLDGGSRDAGDGSYNYVIYDDSRVKVEAKFSLAERRNLVDTQDIPRVKAVTTPLSKRIMSAIKRGKPDPETLGDYSHRKLVDYLHPIRTMIESVGGTVQDTMNAYLQARLAEDAAIARIQGVHDAYVTPAVEALAKVGASLDDLHRYLYARHAPERNRVVGLRNEVGSDLHEAVTNHNIKGASGWSTNEAKQVIRGLQANPEKFAGIQEAARLMRAMIDSSLLDQKKAGLISDETYKLLTEQWQHYVPLRAEDGMDENGNYKPGQGRGFDIRGKEFKAATGRSTEAENIPAWAVSLSERTQLRAEKNNVGKAMLRFINHFDPKGESLAKVYWSNDEGFGDIEKAPPVYQREIGKDGKVTNRTVPPSTIAPDMFAVKVGGKAYYIKFADEKVGLALKKMGVVDLDALSRLARKWTSFQSLVNTRANPAFVPVNIIRDAATGGIHLLDEGFSAGEAAKILTSIPNAWGALWRNARGKPGKNEWDAALKEYIAAGGKISFEPHKTLEDSINELRTKMTEAVNGKRRWKAIWDAFVNFLGDLNDSGENGMRLAAYVAARAQGRTVKQAAFLGRDLTVDFKKHGEVGPLLNSWFVFFNASVQGNYNIAVRLLKSKKVRRAAYMIAASGVLADLLNRALSGDDDDGESYYEKMLRNEPWKFERSMVIFYGGDKGDYFTIPLPYGYNAIYHMGVQAAAAAHGDVKPLDAIAATARVTFDAFNPIGGGGSWLNMFVPTILDPAVEIATNQSFTGAPITPTKFPGDTSPDSQRFFQSTPDWARTVADWMNTATGGNEIEPGLIDVSPDVYEHLWGYVSGGIGRFFGQALDTGSKVATGRSDEIEPQNVPWVRSFMGRVNDDTRRSEYYKQREEVQTVKDRLHDYKESGEPEEVKKYIERHRTAVESIKAFDSAEKGLKKIRKAKRSIDLDRDLSRSEKDEKLKPLKDAELKIMNGVRLVYARNRHRNEP